MKRSPSRPRKPTVWRALAATPALALLLLPAAVSAAVPEPAVSVEEMRRQRRMSDDLYRATNSDASTFEKAIGDPAVRGELEKVLKKSLPDDTLRSMATQARAESEYWLRYRRGIESVIGVEQGLVPGRRRPGLPPPLSGVEPIVNPENLPPPKPFEAGGNLPVPDRWRILDALGRPENWLDPYNTNTYKGDKPIFGEDWFLNVSAISDSRIEPSRVPTGINPQYTARPLENNTFGRYGRLLFNQNLIASFELFQGNTAFKPPDLEFRFTPVFNYNHLAVGEVGLVRINPAKGVVRDDAYLGIQEAFIDKHIRNVSEYYDFDSFRVGIQPFNADFRGFLFQDNQLGVRVFGNRESNRWQYNLALFPPHRIRTRTAGSTRSPESYATTTCSSPICSGRTSLSRVSPRRSFTCTTVTARRKDFHFDQNGFLVRPAQIGDNRGYNYDVNYIGLNGDGHFGRVNLTTSAYYAFGDLSHNQFNPNPNNKGASINAFFAAAEPSIDFDWARFRLSGLYASGAGKPQKSAQWLRRSRREPAIRRRGHQLLYPPDHSADRRRRCRAQHRERHPRRPARLEGRGPVKFHQSRHRCWPALARDFDILPELRVSTNFNYLRFAETAPLEFLRHQSHIRNSLGYDLSAAITYRPLFSQNVVLRLSGSMLLPGDGLRDLFNTKGRNRAVRQRQLPLCGAGQCGRRVLRQP